MIDENMKEYRTLNPRCRFCVYCYPYHFNRRSYDQCFLKNETRYECKLKKEDVSFNKSAKRCKYYLINEDE